MKHTKIQNLNYPYIFSSDRGGRKLETSLLKAGNPAAVKLTPFKVHKKIVGETSYLPAVSKEWKNSVYTYNSNTTKNYPAYNLNINTLIKGYFNMYFKNKFMSAGWGTSPQYKHKLISRKKRIMSLNKILVSKAEVKHTNSKAIITIFVYNREQMVLDQKLSRLIPIFNKLVLFLMKFNLAERFKASLGASLKGETGYPSVFDYVTASSHTSKESVNSIFMNTFLNKIFRPLLELKNFKNIKSLSDTLIGEGELAGSKDKSLRLKFQYSLYKIRILLKNIRRLKLKLNLNHYKMEKQFLSKLGYYISQYYGKEVEFNIVNLKSITHNSDIFTQILTSKMKKERASPLALMNLLLSKFKFNDENPSDRSKVLKFVDNSLVANKFKNINISSILSNNMGVSGESSYPLDQNSSPSSLNELLMNIHKNTTMSNDYSESENLTVEKIILNKIKYKDTRGVRIRVKGRLTKRYKAARATYKFKWKGGLKNLDSAFKGLSSVVYRGHLDSNVEKSMLASKRRIGSFAVSGWLATK